MKRTRSALAMLALAAALSGCGQTPTSPLADAPPALAATGAAGAAMGQGRGQIDVAAVPADPPGPRGVTESANVDGALGVSMGLASITVDVPGHAFAGRADITMTVPDSAQLEVQLTISPSGKNHFDHPVTLGFDARRLGRDCRTLQIEWFDPAQDAWVVIPSTVDRARGTISAQLWHFSRYRASSEIRRAGWCRGGCVPARTGVIRWRPREGT